MEKVNLPFFYQLGTQLNPLTKMTVASKNRYDVVFAAYSVLDNINTLLGWGGRLNVCQTSGQALKDAINDAIKSWNDFNALKEKDKSKSESSVDAKIQKFIDKAKIF